ncbi:uncharacterized protein LOC110980101 isoform X2 [Acanthaster planci]|uniref:Uncharacterized protein LOC110980101 isoform X2 n=1 Tax=Acanthaster planci TaxID=133434 RepID=A0A8B7YFW9_ACAPL|nr:uncharacterized protein LOC110980101 isoform X2 [Acanthaster planci]
MHQLWIFLREFVGRPLPRNFPFSHGTMEVRVQGHIELVFFLVLITMMSLVGGDDGAMKNKARTTFTSKQSPDLGPNGRTFSETDGLDNKISAFLRDKHYTGATIGIARRDEVLYTQGYGHLDDDIQMTPTNLLPISSLSKTITAVAILKLVENGDLKLTDPVFGPDGILSSFKPPKKKDMDPRLLNIMVGHLLHHTAGWSQTRPQLHDPMMNSVYLSRGHNVTDIATEMNLGHDLSPNDVITYMMRQPLDHPPGMKYEYSNFGYSVLGRVIEHISGKRDIKAT